LIQMKDSTMVIKNTTPVSRSVSIHQETKVQVAQVVNHLILILRNGIKARFLAQTLE
jgi:hypothetical protein